MKKFFVTTALAMSVLMAMPTFALALTDNYISHDVSARADSELVIDPPILYIESGDHHRKDLYFELNLTNAEWLYSGSGSIEPGLSYTVFSSTSMGIEVDFAQFAPDVNDIKIPMKTKILSNGGQCTVTIDSRGSTVSDGTYVFAHVNYPWMSVTVNNKDTDAGTFDIAFVDDYPYSMANGRLFELKLDNGYTFESFASAEGTGKYAGKVGFRIESKNASIAYVSLTSTSGISEGTIKIKGIKVNAKDGMEGTAVVYVTPAYGDGGTLSFPAVTFSKTETPDTEGKEDENKKEDDKRQVLFTVGNTGYTVDKFMIYKTDAAPFIDDSGRTMLPLRDLANAFNIDDDHIHWNDNTKTVTITDTDGKQIVTVVGSTALKVGTQNVTMDTTAIIKGDRVYLPMRAILNAMGISDDNIVWNSSAKTVLVYDIKN